MFWDGCGLGWWFVFLGCFSVWWLLLVGCVDGNRFVSWWCYFYCFRLCVRLLYWVVWWLDICVWWFVGCNWCCFIWWIMVVVVLVFWWFGVGLCMFISCCSWYWYVGVVICYGSCCCLMGIWWSCGYIWYVVWWFIWILIGLWFCLWCVGVMVFVGWVFDYLLVLVFWWIGVWLVFVELSLVWGGCCCLWIGFVDSWCFLVFYILFGCSCWNCLGWVGCGWRVDYLIL